MKIVSTKYKHNGGILLAGLALFSLIGCLDKPDFTYTGEGKDLPAIESFFDYATEKEVSFTVQYSSTDTPIPFEIHTQNPMKEMALDGVSIETPILVRNPEVTAFAAGLTDKEGYSSISVKLPTATKEVYIYTNSIGVEQCYKVAATGEAIHATIPSLAKSQAKTRNTTGETRLINGFTTSPAVNNLSYPYGEGKWFVNGAPAESTLEVIDNRIVEAANLLRNNSIRLTGVALAGNSKTAYFLNKYLLDDDFVVADDGEVILQVLSTQCAWPTNLAYYVYDKDYLDTSDPASLTKLESLEKYMILPLARCADANVTGAPNPLVGIADNIYNPTSVEVTTIKLINPANKDNPETKYKFSKGTKIGFALYIHVGIDYDPTLIRTDKINYTTAISGKNALTIPEEPAHNSDLKYNLHSYPCQMAASVRVDGLIDENGDAMRYEVFGFEHDRWWTWPDYDFDDVIFGLTNIIGTDELIEELPPAEINKKGLLLFEDLWPLAGDYDMNDLVAKYDITHYIDEENSYLLKSDYNFKVVWAGASYYNSFNLLLPNANAIDRVEDHYTTTVPGFPDGVIANQVQNIQYDSDKEGLILKLDNEGVDIEDGRYMKICQDIQWLFQRHGPTQRLPEAEYKFTVHYKPYTSSLGVNTFNPFINVQDVMPASSREVHLIGNAPTSINKGTYLFNSEKSNDRSLTPQADGKTYWYAGENYLPFAINLVDPGDGSVLSIDFYKRQHFINSRNEAVEYQESIDKYFPDFLKWTSRVPGYEDWWKNYVQPDYSDRHY